MPKNKTPKNKTHSGSAKRFKVTGSGKIRRRQAGRGRHLEELSSRRKRRLAADVDVPKADAKKVRRMLGG